MTDTTKGRASVAEFNDLHALVASSLIEQIQAWKAGRLVEYKGEEGYVKIFPPALLAQAIKFLKDNKIDAPASSNKALQTLSESLPDLTGGNVVNIR